MRSTKKWISMVLAVIMLITTASVSFTAFASTGTLSSYYATNPSGKVGIQKTITIDGDASDWSEDMLIAQGAAWDIANNYKGGHENCVLDTYALFASWDNSNLYVGWQMVNTTDTWAREGDGPLSDGGRVLDVPLILALSVDPSSVSMSSHETSENTSIWKLDGVKFDTHVDHLLYMSGKPGLGEPAMFTAVDAQGNTSYKTGTTTFAKAGIEYKMAQTNICSHIYGLNGSKSTSDIYSDSANWVDYKTFKGSQGVHNTKYDSFYEIKIPLSALGIDASYIKNNGIGAMLVATRGESGLDCIPYDDAMLDNALGSYAKDPSTSGEKDDVDIITSDLARIGKLSGDEPATQPTTAIVTTQPATETPTTNPIQDSALTVNAKSNILSSGSVNASAKNSDTVTVKYNLKSAMKVVNAQWSLSYDPSVLKLQSATTPNLASTTNIYNNIVYGVYSGATSLADFTTEKTFVQAEFEVIGSGSTDVTLNVDELSVGYTSGGKLIYQSAVEDGAFKNLSSVSGFSSNSISGKAVVTTGEVNNTALTVNASSNFFPTAAKNVPEGDTQVTVAYKLSSYYPVMNAQWVLTYDPAKLTFDKSSVDSLMPNVTGDSVEEVSLGTIAGNFSKISGSSFSTEKDFIQIKFDVIGTGTTDVNLQLEYLGVINDAGNPGYLVDNSVVKNLSAVSGFTKSSHTVNTVIDSGDGSYLLGDVNNDGNITIIDATLIQRKVAGLTSFTETQELAADVNRDGIVNIADATQIQRYVAKIITSF